MRGTIPALESWGNPRLLRVARMLTVFFAVGIAPICAPLGIATAGFQDPPAEPAPQPAEPAAPPVAPPEPPPPSEPPPANDAEKPADTAPEEGPLERKIYFSFSKTPWDVALTRFAELADLQLILKYKPPGTFDYQSNKPYTIPQALDVINEVLLAQGFVVLRNDRFLTLAPLDQPLPLNQVPIVDAKDLESRGRNEFVTISRRLAFADPTKIEAEIKRLLGPYGEIQVVPSLKMVRITDQVSRLRESLPLLEELDNAAKPAAAAQPPPAPAKVRRTFVLEHITPERAVTLIKAILGLSGTLEPGPDDKSLIAVLTPAELDSIAEFLKEIDITTSGDSAPAERTIALEHAKADQLATILKTVFDEKEVTAAAEPVSNVLVAKGPGKLLDEIATLAKVIDERAKVNAPTQETYRTGGREPAAVVTQLQAAFVRKDGPEVTITADVENQSVIVLAPPKVQEQIRTYLTKLGGAPGDSTGEQTAVVKLEHASAAKLATTLTAVFPKAATGASFGSEETSNAVIIRAPTDTLERISQVIKDLDLPPTVMGLRDKIEEIFEPKNLPAAELVKNVEKLYPTSTNVVLVPSAQANKIIVSAPTVLMPKVKATLELVDRAMGTAPSTDRTYTLRHAKASELATMLTQIFPPSRYEIRLVPDDRNNRLYVAAADEAIHQRLSEMINELDTLSPDQEMIEIYTPANAPPGDLVETLLNVFGGESPKPTIQLQSDNKSILVRAPKAMQQRIGELFTKLDVPREADGPQPTDELYKLKFAKAAELVTALSKIYPPDRSNVKISSEPTNNVLIVTAPPEVQERIAELIKKVDVPSESRMKLEIYSPGEGSPTSLATLIGQMKYEELGSVSTSPDGRLLLVMASPATHTKIKALIEQLSTADATTAPVRKTYEVQHTTASSLVTMLQPLFSTTGQPSATIVADPQGRQIIVQAPPRVHDAITDIIKQVDQPSKMVESFYVAKHVPVVSLYSQIYALFGGVEGTRVTYDTGSNTVGVVGLPAVQSRIAAFVEKLDQPIDPMTGKIRATYKAQHVPAANIYSALVTLFPAAETGASFNYETSNQIVIAFAHADLQKRIQEEVTRLDVSPRAEWLTKSLKPKHVSATQLYTFLTTQMATVTSKSISMGAREEEVVISGPAAVQEEVQKLLAAFDVPPAEGGEKVRRIYRPTFANPYYLSLNLQSAFGPETGAKITYDTYSATVTVVAPAAVVEKIDAEFALLDENPRKSWIEKTFEPKHISTDQLYTMLTSALTQESNKSLAAAPDGRRLVAVAPPSVMERIDRLVTALDVAPSEGTQAQTKSYNLRYAAASSIYYMLSQLFPSASGVKFYFDSATSTITVIAPASVQEQVATIVTSMDVDPNAQKMERVFTPKNVPAPQLVTLLQTALASERTATVALGPQKQTVVVFAPEDSMPRIEKYIQTLDTTAATETTRQIYKLQYGNAAYLVSTLQALYPPAQFPVVVTSDAVNNLLVVEAPQLIQEKVAKLISELDVQQGGRMQAVYRLEHTRASSVLAAVQAMLGSSSATVVAGPDDKSLVVNALPAQHQQVKTFVADFDKPENSQDPKSKVYNLRFATASNVARMVGQLFAAETRVRVTYDDVMNSLYVSAPPELLGRIEQMVNDSDQEGADAQMVSEVVRLRNASANDVSRALSAAFPDRKKAIFVADSDSGTVFVRAYPALVESIKKMVGDLDQPRSRPERDVAVIDLFAADPFEAQGIVENLFDDVPQDDRPRVEATFNPPRLVVRASAEQLEEVRKVIGQIEGSKGGQADLERPPPGLAEKPHERVIRLNNADPIATMSSIEQAWPMLRRNKLNVIRRTGPLDRVQPPVEPEELPKVEEGPEIDPATLPGDPQIPVNVIVGNDRLTATSRDIEALDVLQSLADAWTAPFDPDRSASRVFYVEHADVAELVRAIDEAFNGRESRDGDRRRFRPERVRVVAEPSANALIVRASPVDLVNVKELIDQLDLPAATDKRPRIIPLKQADAQEVVTVIRQVFADYLASGSGPPIAVPGVRGSTARSRTSAMSVDIDTRSNSLIVSAPPSVLSEVEKLVEGMESAAADTTKSYRVIPIQNASPTDVRDALEILLNRQLERSTGRSSGTRSTPNRRPRRTNTPRRPRTSEVVPSKQNPKTIVATIQPGGAGDATVRSVAADQDDLEASALINAGGQEEAPSALPTVGPISGMVDITVLEDVGAILLLGTEGDLEMLADIIREIEKITQNRELTFEILPLEHAKAASLADLLNELYGRIVDARGAQTLVQGQSTVIPLAKPNAVLLVAGRDELPQLVELAKKFDVEVNPEGEFRIFPLRHVRAALLSQTIENFYGNRGQDGDLATEALVEPDDRSNSLIVYAAPRDMAEIASLIRELDTAKTARVNELRIFYLKHTVATELSATLNTALQSTQTTATTTASAARGLPGLELNDPNSPTGTVDSGVLESVTITPNRRANAIIVSAPKDTMKLIESLIGQLDVLPEAISEIKVFTLVNSDAATMIQTLRSLFAQLDSQQNRVTVTTDTDTGGNPLIELSFSLDERTNSILASGSKQQLEVVEAIILRLDSSDIEERRTDVYRLKNAQAQDVATALTDLLSQQQQLEGVQEGISLQQQLEKEIVVVPELLSNSLLISASPRFYDRVIDIIEKLDELPPQVVIQVLLAEVELDNDCELGVELGLQDSILFNRSNLNSTLTNETAPFFRDGATPGFNFNTGGPLGDNFSATDPSIVGTQGLTNFALGRVNETLGYGGLVLSASSESVSVLIRALARERRLEVLSRPQIMTLDNQTASIVVGAEVPRITGSNLVQGAGVTQSIEYVPSGIILEVTPKINPDGTVIMNVSPEISRLAPANDPDANVTIAPGVVARALEITRAVTTISTQDGQTAVIGGLIRKSAETEERKVPCLGDVPVLGHLFRYDQLTKRRSELLIILTPHVVRSRGDAERIKAMEAARMNWCLSAVEKMHGDLGLPTEVYLGESPETMGIETMETAPVDVLPGETIVPGESDFNDPDLEQMAVPPVPSPPSPNPEDSSLKRNGDKRSRQSVAKQPADKNRPDASGPDSTKGRASAPQSHTVAKPKAPPVDTREAARAQREKADAKIFQTPMERRRDRFSAWKDRNLPWKRPTTSEKSAAP